MNPIWNPADQRVIVLGGTGDMGSLTSESNPIGRFALGGEPFYLRSLLLHFEGGTGDAVWKLVRHELDNSPIGNQIMDKINQAGSTNDIRRNISYAGELDFYLFGPRQHAVMTWTNPDPGNMHWYATATLIPYSAVRWT